ncbi:MAG: ATP-binding protein [Usitatibacter sp.]
MKITWTNFLGHTGYWLAAIAIATTGWTFYGSTVKARESQALVERTLEIQQGLAQLAEAMYRLASAQRGYLLSGEKTFANEHRALHGSAEKWLGRLVTLSASDPTLAAKIARLETLVARRISAMGAVHFDGVARGTALALDDARQMAILDDEIESVERVEMGLLKANRAQQREILDHSLELLGLAMAACLAVMIPGYVGFIAQARSRQRVQLALVKSRDAAERASRAKSTFLATVSHEIRTPMNGVLGMLELLSLTRLDREQRATLGIVRESGTSLLRIIDDLLDFSKIEAGKLTIVPEVASIDAIVASVFGIFAGNASSKGLTLKRFVDPVISAAVVVDPVRLQQVLRNFVMNSIKFTHQGHIEIRAELLERKPGTDVVRFSVKDTGIGISRDDQEKLFQPFAQAGGVAHHGAGTGLGLSICQRLATLMGGTLAMQSEVGSGTTMLLTLPLQVADAAALTSRLDRDEVQHMHRACRTAPTVARAEADGTLVLLVDDHPINRLVLMRQVNSLGYATEIAENGVEALAKWESRRFGMVITDCNMPQMDGFALARAIRESEHRLGSAHMPIVACTANAMDGEAGKCFAAGMDDYLAKPIELARLQDKLDRWLPIPADSAAARLPALDPSILDVFSQGDAAVRSEILQQFRRYNDEDGVQLKRALKEGDAARVASTSHRIKGASRTIGASGLASVCERIERASRANDMQAATADSGAFDEELDRLNSSIGPPRAATKNSPIEVHS